MSSDEIVSLEPATGAEMWRGTSGDVEDAVSEARQAWPAWAAKPLATRIEIVRRFANEVRKEAEAFAQLIARETGKPLWEAKSEVEAVIDRVEIAVSAFAERTGQRKKDSALQGTQALRHKPHGVMAVIGPCDLPAEAPAGHIIPALIAGNAVVFKPSDLTPATGEFLIQRFHEAGIPPETVQVLIGRTDTGHELAVHSGVDGVLFTGSSTEGIEINRRLAEEPGKILSLAMGGNNPIVLWQTPLIRDAAALIVQSAFATAGQRRTSARRLIVKSDLYDQALEEITILADRLIIGEPFDDPAPFMGPVIDNAAADSLTESFLYLLSNGGKAIRHMRRPRGDLPFLSPAIIDVTEVQDRPDRELSGPLLQIVRTDDLDEAIAQANATRFGLTAALIGGSPQDYGRFWANIRVGNVNWNRPTTNPAANAPFGGIGHSGNHRAGGTYAADYCAYPVASSEMEQPRASIGIGLKDA